MSRVKLSRMLVIDMEMTCWEAETPPNEISEPIAIAVVELLMNEPIPTIGKTADFLIRPQYSHISPYCTELTGITPKMAHSGRYLGEVCSSLNNKFGGGIGKTWSAWGDDKSVLDFWCRKFEVPVPFAGPYVNLGALWGILTGAHRAVGLELALKQLNIEFEGTPHRQLDDALNTAKIWISLSTDIRFKLNQFLTNDSHLKQ